MFPLQIHLQNPSNRVIYGIVLAIKPPLPILFILSLLELTKNTNNIRNNNTKIRKDGGGAPNHGIVAGGGISRGGCPSFVHLLMNLINPFKSYHRFLLAFSFFPGDVVQAYCIICIHSLFYLQLVYKNPTS